ncbi:hypothetical protein PAJ34TS1_11060 [Paenibacillus azoreducens]|uniref:Uncharacterized protein n=1 Tax=Paenibacillus azoreducens TaxID=116718 RepID=A0A919YAF9_9BACL|nr:hypothetical protein J34TS1_15640 [Paenibacillus azoreducens]
MGSVSGIVAGVLGGWMFENLDASVLYRICCGGTICGFIGFFWLRHSFRTAEKQVNTQIEQFN